MTARSPLARPVRLPLAAATGFVLLLVLLLVLVAAGWAPLARLDGALSDRARDHGTAHPGAVELQRHITGAGQTTVFFAVGLIGAAVLLARRAYAGAALIGAAFATVPAAWGILHALLHRPRPEHGFVVVSSNGFPSGHSANSATIALVAVLLAWPHLGRIGRALLVTVAVAYPVLIGATRVTLLAHWPSDVIGAWLLVLAIVPLLAWVIARVVPSHR